jgi:hypothetical protein
MAAGVEGMMPNPNLYHLVKDQFEQAQRVLAQQHFGVLALLKDHLGDEGPSQAALSSASESVQLLAEATPVKDPQPPLPPPNESVPAGAIKAPKTPAPQLLAVPDASRVGPPSSARVVPPGQLDAGDSSTEETAQRVSFHDDGSQGASATSMNPAMDPSSGRSTEIVGGVSGRIWELHPNFRKRQMRPPSGVEHESDSGIPGTGRRGKGKGLNRQVTHVHELVEVDGVYFVDEGHAATGTFKLIILHPYSFKRGIWDIMCVTMVLYDLVMIPLGLFDPEPTVFS